VDRSEDRVRWQVGFSQQDWLGSLSPGAAGATIFSGGLLGAPVMAGLASMMGAGAFGIGLYSAISETDQYRTNDAATNTNIDPNKSLMPPEMKGHWGWVVASWVGVGLDFAAAVQATRLLKMGMTVDEVVKTTSKAHGIPEDILKGAYTASGKGTSDPVMLKNVLTSALPKEIAEQAGKNVDVTVLSAEEFAKQTGSKTGNAVTKLVKGEDGVLRAQVIVKEGADPATLLEEAAHVAQTTDPKMIPKLEQLTEDKLANWSKMSTEEQLQLYRTKIEVEIDAQQKLLGQYKNTADPEYLSKVQFQLDNLNARLGQTDQALKNPQVKPDWLDTNQAPRLFSKGPKDPLTAMDLGISQERFEALSNAVSDEQLRRLSLHVGPESLSSLAKRDPKAIQSYARILELADSDPVAREALLRFLPPSKVHIPNTKFEQCLQEVETFLQKYQGRVAGDFPERFGRKFTPKGDGPQAESELKLAEDLLDGKTEKGKDLEIEGLVGRKDQNGKIIQGEQLPEYRVTTPDGRTFLAEVKRIEVPLSSNNLDNNLKKAISQVKEGSLRTGEKGGYIRIDASNSPSSLLNQGEIENLVRARLTDKAQRGFENIEYVEVLYKDASGTPQKLLAKVQDNQVTTTVTTP
jgi:hypothetical protein